MAYHHNNKIYILLIKNLIDINLQRVFLPFKANRKLCLSQISQSINKKGRLNENILEYKNS